MFWDLLKAPSVSQDPLTGIALCNILYILLHNFAQLFCCHVVSPLPCDLLALQCLPFSNLVSVYTLVALLVTSLLDSIAVSLFVD